MSRRAGSPKLEVNLEQSPPRANPIVESPNTSISSREMSPEGSCVSSEPEDESMQYPDNREATTPMVVLGCHRCLMYVISSEVDPKCPRCQSTVLRGLLNEESPMKAGN